MLLIKKAILYQENQNFMDGKYSGQYSKDPLFPNGFGIFIQNGSGATYEGWRKFGLRSGHGRLIQDNGLVYEGMWSDNKPDGHGCVRYPIVGGTDGDVFCGEFSASKRNGPGTLFLIKDQILYRGTWENDLLEGQVIIKDKSKNIRIELYQHGNPVKTEKITFYLDLDHPSVAFALN